MRLPALSLLTLALACGIKPSSQLMTTAGPVALDPRCVPDASSYAPALRLVSDAGRQADDSYLTHDVVEVVVDGLPPCVDVDLYFQMAQGGHSFGHFRSGFNGSVSTARDVPLDGTWSVADPDGPLWSMADDDGGSPDIDVVADISQSVTLETLWKRRLRVSNSDVLPVRGYKGVYADLYLPPGRPPFPGLIVFGGSEGGLGGGQLLARAFVGEGYLVMALDYFDPANPALPATLEKVPLEYFAAAIDVLKEHQDLRAGRIGLVGDSRGGEAALLVASHFPDVKAVIAVVPSGLVWPYPTVTGASTWTFADAGVPFVPWGNTPPDTYFNDAGVRVISEVNQYRDSVRLASASALQAATTPVEQVAGPVLLLAAQDDHVWPSCQLADVAWQRLRDAGHDTRYPDDEFICFAQAGHSLNPANVGLPAGNANEFDQNGGRYDFGGTPQGTGQGDRQAWNKSVRFLERTLKVP